MSAKKRPAFPFTKAVRLCICTIICPYKLEKEISGDTAYISSLEKDNQPSVLKIQYAFWNSSLLILVSGILGLLIGLLLKCYVSPTTNIVSLLQMLGA